MQAIGEASEIEYNPELNMIYKNWNAKFGDFNRYTYRDQRVHTDK